MIDIPAARPLIGDAEMRAVAAVLASGQLVQGAEVEAFEQEFSSQVVEGAACVAVNSGTSALHLSLLASGIGAGDEVIVPSFTFAATANAVALTGATPVFVDIDPLTFCMDAEAARAAVGPRTQAVLPVHLYGHPAPMPELRTLCAAHGLLLLEDAAQAHAASVDGVPVGSWGAAGAFSFYPTKNMTSGEGGMVTTRDPEVVRKVRLLRNQGQQTRYVNEIVGFNNRMTDIHAAIGRAQLRRLDEWTRARQSHAALLTAGLCNVVTPTVREGTRHVFHQYTIRVDPGERDSIVEGLRQRGIGSAVYYPTPCHRLSAYHRGVDLPETDRASRECLSLPVHPSLTLQELERVVEAVNSLVSR